MIEWNELFAGAYDTNKLVNISEKNPAVLEQIYWTAGNNFFQIMQLYKNNYFYGWKYNASARKLNESKSSTGFVMSLITALIIVMVVSQVLSLIDHKIQYKDLKGYSFNEAFQPKQAFASGISDRLSGKILLQVESNGEGWYINPKNLKRYYLGRPDDAFRIMRELSLGISNNDFDDFHGYAPLRLSGQILLIWANFIESWR